SLTLIASSLSRTTRVRQRPNRPSHPGGLPTIGQLPGKSWPRPRPSTGASGKTVSSGVVKAGPPAEAERVVELGSIRAGGVGGCPAATRVRWPARTITSPPDLERTLTTPSVTVTTVVPV